MDVTFNNVLQGTRPYFLGVPKPAQAEGSGTVPGQPVWPAGNSPPVEGAPATSGAPAPSSRPPSAAAAPPAPIVTHATDPPRPPSEPLEPEPHIIHKATVMREAAEKRREQPSPVEDEEPSDELSPPPHIIRRPSHTLPSPSLVSTVPSPSPARPPSVAPPPPAVEPQPDAQILFRPTVHRVQTPTSRSSDPYAPSRPPDPHSASRPPETFARYSYDATLSDGARSSRGPTAAAPQSSIGSRPGPQTYARITGSMPHASSRLRETTTHSLPAQRYIMQPAPSTLPPHNDRVPPIHHPQMAPPPLTHRHATTDGRSAHAYHTSTQRRELSPYGQATTHYDRHQHVVAPPRKYDPQQAYPGYRPAPAGPPPQNHRAEPQHHQLPYKTSSIDTMSAHYVRHDSAVAPPPPKPPVHSTRVPARLDYPSSRTVDGRNNYSYPTPSTSATRYAPTAVVPVVPNSAPATRTPIRQAAAAPKTYYEYLPSTHSQTSPARSTVKPGYPNQQARMTVSVTSLVNQMNQTKQKRESPLDLSVKTVKNSADSSTTQDDAVDSATMEIKGMPLPPRSSSSLSTSNRHVPMPTAGYVASHKVDFAPDFNQYRERSHSQSSSHSYSTIPQPNNPPAVRSLHNGSYEPRRPVEQYSVESRHQIFPDRCKFSAAARTEFQPRIDLTKSGEERRPDNRIRDDRQFVIEERKRPPGPPINNIPEKIVRYETWTADSRIDRINQSAREQHELMSRPVYSYSAYQIEQRRPMSSSVFREHPPHPNHRYPHHPNFTEPPLRETSEYHSHYHNRTPPLNRHIIQKLPDHRELHPHHHVDLHSGVPADKRVLSLLRNSLETKQTGLVDPVRYPREVPDLIVIDDGDDDITDLTKDTENDLTSNRIKKHTSHFVPGLDSHIQMPKAIDSLPRDSDNDNFDPKSKSPENDVARIRTKAELKVMPPSQDTSIARRDFHLNNGKTKILPKSQKQHLFNQIRQDLRLESVIKSEKPTDSIMPEIKTEPMNIDEIEKDAELSIKNESLLVTLEPESKDDSGTAPEEDFDWANACESFVEQLKTGSHKKKTPRKRVHTIDRESVPIIDKPVKLELSSDQEINKELLPITIKQEPMDEDDKIVIETPPTPQTPQEPKVDENREPNNDKAKFEKNPTKNTTKQNKGKSKVHSKKRVTTEESSSSKVEIKKEKTDTEPTKTQIKEESESTDDDEPLIKSKLMKEKEKREKLKYQLLKDLSEKSAYVKLECCDVDMNKNTRISIDSISKDKEEIVAKGKLSRQSSRSKLKPVSVEGNKNEKRTTNDNSSSDSDDDALSVASRLRTRKGIKAEDIKTQTIKTSGKSSQKKTESSSSSSSTPLRKGFGDGSDFHPGWEEELYKYKRSLRMPSRLIAIPRGRSGGPFLKGSSALFTRGSTSLPDLDPAPLSPAPSSVPSAATDDLYARRPDKLTLDSDLDSNSSYSIPHRLHYDSEASTSTVFSTSKAKKKPSSIVDVLIQKCGKRDEPIKKSKEDKMPKVIPKSSNKSEILPTPSLGLVKNGTSGGLSAKKEKLMEEIYYLGAFRKETVTAYRNDFIQNTNGLLGATEEFAPVVLKTRTRTESRVLKQRATIREVFGDERPASAPPTSCREPENVIEEEEPVVKIKKEPESKPRLKNKKMLKDKLKLRPSSIRDGLRSNLVKRSDAKGRMLRLRKRHNLMKSLANKRIKDNKHKKDKSPALEDKEQDKSKEGSSLGDSPVNTKRRLKRLFGRRKFSSGFDYIRKKKKIIRRDESSSSKIIRRHAAKPTPESVHDIQKEIKGWFINKSIGETHLHRAARLGYTDCVAYCLDKLNVDVTAKDNAGFTALHVAAAKGHVRIARLLLQYGANVSAAAQGGIRPLHEACENNQVEVIRLLLSYGADPVLGTYSGQTPGELAEGAAAMLLRLYIADVRGEPSEPWKFPPPTDIIDYEELGCDPLSSPPPATPPPPLDATMEIQCTNAPLPPFYTLRPGPGQQADGLWCLLLDVTSFLQIKSKDYLLKQIHCGSGSPRELLLEMRTQEFIERAQCHQLLCAGEKVNPRASKVALVRVTDKLRQLLKIETVLVS